MTSPDPTKPWAGYIQDQQYSAFQDRMIQIGKVNHQALPSGLQCRNGILLGGGDGNSNINLNVRPAGGMNITIDAGSAIIDGYSVINPIRQTMTVQPSTSTPRRDAVILRVYDTEQGDAVSKTVIEITKGTTTSTPALPTRSHQLAYIDVGANVTTISPVDTRDFTTSTGGVVPYYGSRPDIQTIANGQIVHSLNTGLNDQRDGDTYHPLGATYTNHAYGSWAVSEFTDINAWANKAMQISLSRTATVLIFGAVNFHQWNQGSSTVAILNWLWDGNEGGNYIINTGSNRPYTVDHTQTIFGVVSNAQAGTHTLHLGLKPTLGDPIEVMHMNMSAIAIS